MWFGKTFEFEKHAYVVSQISAGWCRFANAVARDAVGTSLNLDENTPAVFSESRHCIQLKLSHLTLIVYFFSFCLL